MYIATRRARLEAREAGFLVLNIFGPNFQRLVLFYMKYIYAKGNVVQQIQLSNCPMFCQKWAKNAFLFSLFLILHLTA